MAARPEAGVELAELTRLRKRSEFLNVRAARRAVARTLVIEADRARHARRAAGFGFTITKKTAPRAVDRNRLRRRLREIVRMRAPVLARPGYDYVVIGRKSGLLATFTALTRDFETCMKAVHKSGAPAVARVRPADRPRKPHRGN